LPPALVPALHRLGVYVDPISHAPWATPDSTTESGFSYGNLFPAVSVFHHNAFFWHYSSNFSLIRKRKRSYKLQITGLLQ